MEKQWTVPGVGTAARPLRCGLLVLVALIAWTIPLSEGVTTCPSGWTPVVEASGMCILPSDVSLPWKEAVSYCQTRQSSLAITGKEAHRMQVETISEKLDRDEVWMNAKNGPRVWTWGENKKELNVQGCWNDDPNQPDLPYLAPLAPNLSITPEACVNACRQGSYTAASLQISQDLPVCRCGKSFGKYSRAPIGDCLSPCPQAASGEPITYCGGKRKQLVFAVIRTTVPLPVEFEYLGFSSQVGECAALVNKDPVNWVQKSCSERLPFVCEKRTRRPRTRRPRLGRSLLMTTLPQSMISPPPSMTTAPQLMTESAEDCITRVPTLRNACITLHTEKATWYQARATCLNEGGRLLQLDRPVRPRDLGWRPGDGMPQNWWIGATIFNWKTDNQNLPVYDGWAPSQPYYSPIKEQCILATEGNDYRWSVADCNERKHFYCVGLAANVTPIPSSPLPISGKPVTPSVNDDDDNDDNISPTGLSLTSAPPSGTPAPQQGVDKTIIVGAIGAGVGVGFVLVVICIVLACRRCAKRRGDHGGRDSPKSGGARRLPSIPKKKKHQKYHSSPPRVLSKMSADGKDETEEVEDDGDYAYIDLDETAGPVKDPEDGVTYEPLIVVEGEDVKIDKDGNHVYEGLDDTYVIAMEPPEEGGKGGIKPPKGEKGDEGMKGEGGIKPPTVVNMEDEKEKEKEREKEKEKEGKEEGEEEPEVTYAVVNKHSSTVDTEAEDKPIMAEDKPSRDSVVEDNPSPRESIYDDKPSRDSDTEDKPSRESLYDDKPSRDSVVDDKPSKDPETDDKQSRDSVAEDKPSRDSVTDDKPSIDTVDEEKPSRNSMVGISQPD